MPAVEHKIKPVNHLNVPSPAAAKGKEGEKDQIVTGKLQMEQICRKAASSKETGACLWGVMVIICYLKRTHTSNRGELGIRPFFLADTENSITALKTHSSLGGKWLPLENICYVQMEQNQAQSDTALLLAQAAVTNLRTIMSSMSSE